MAKNNSPKFKKETYKWISSRYRFLIKKSNKDYKG